MSRVQATDKIYFSLGKKIEQRICCEPFCTNLIRRGVRCRSCVRRGGGAPPKNREVIVDVVLEVKESIPSIQKPTQRPLWD